MSTQRRPPPPPTSKYRKSPSTQLSTTSSNTSYHSTIIHNDTSEHSPTPPSLTYSSSHSHSNTSNSNTSTPTKPSKTVKGPSPINNKPINKPLSFQYNKSNSTYSIHKKSAMMKSKPTLTTSSSTTSISHKKNSQKPPPVPQYLLDKYKQNSPRNTNKSSSSSSIYRMGDKCKPRHIGSVQKQFVEKVDSPRPKMNDSSKSFTLKTATNPKGMIPDNKIIDCNDTTFNIPNLNTNNIYNDNNNFNLIQSQSSPTHADVDEFNNTSNKDRFSNNNNNNNHNIITKTTENREKQSTMSNKKKSRHSSNPSGLSKHSFLRHSRENSISYSSNNNNIDAVTFNSLLLTQDIETYKVVFNTRVCGIELIPFDENSNLGAVVIKCHTDFSKEKVIIQSLLIAINGELCIDTDYDDILSIISQSIRPLKLTFHPPTVDKNDMIDQVMHKTKTNDKYQNERPSITMKLNDESIDGDYNNNRFINPNALINKLKDNKINNDDLILIQKHYTMLYHKYCELTQFQQLTNHTVHDKMNEIKRLNKENMTLKSVLNSRKSELQRITMNQSNEKQKGKEILDKYQKLNDKNIDLEKKNIEQKQEIQRLQYELQRRENNDKYNKNKAKNRSKTPHNISHKKSISNQVDTALQNELRCKLNIETKQKHFSVNSIHRHRTPPPPSLRKNNHHKNNHSHHHHHHHKQYHHHHNRENKQISLQTPIYNKNKQQQRSRSDGKEENGKITKQKRASGIGLLFKNFTKRKDTDSSNGSGSDKNMKNNKYHPQIQKFVKHKKKKKKKTAQKDRHNNHSKINVESRARSTSLESNVGRARKETIV